jgi:hypothetical protein
MHWTKDSYPQSGGNPQELLNSQIVDDADTAIAVFWTRFGTSTDEYGSGTEEEIERLISDDKQVFMYFLDKPIPPSATDTDEYGEQRKKLSAFKKRYENKGIYRIVADENALKEQFARHLFLYFAKHMEEDVGSSSGRENSKLTIASIDGTSSAVVRHLDISAELQLDDKNDEIIREIESVQPLPPVTAAIQEDDVHASNTQYSLPNALGAINAMAMSLSPPRKRVMISEAVKQFVADFCSAFPYQQRDYDSEYENGKKNFFGRIRDIHDWVVFPQGDNDILKLKIDKLNQFRAMNFPSRLFFKEAPAAIPYSITAKHTPNVIRGEITVFGGDADYRATIEDDSI